MEVNAHIKQGIGTSTWARQFHDRRDALSLAYYERGCLTRDMVRGGVHAQNQIARADGIVHRFHPFMLCGTMDLDQQAASALHPTTNQPRAE